MDKYFKKITENEYEYYPEDKRYYSMLKLQEEFDVDACVNPKFIAELQKDFNTATKKVNCVLPSFAKKGIDTMPVWRDEMDVKVPDGQFRFVTGRHAQFTQNSTQNNAILLEMMKENYIWISKNDAARLDIKLGDVVEVKSRTGSVTIKAYPTDKIISGVVYFVHGFGAESEGLTLGAGNGASDNAIIEDIIEPVFGSAAMHESIVKVRRVS